jgi:hypothetical protein
MMKNEARPFDAYDGGAKVLNAVTEVFKHGGSAEAALDAGRRALSDLRQPVPEPPK